MIRIKGNSIGGAMEKKYSGVKCEKCGLEFPESELSEEHKDRAFIWKDRVYCNDCLIMMGVDPANTTD